MSFIKALSASALGLCMVTSAVASPFVNGSFESGLANIGQFATLAGGDTTSITGWTIGGGSSAVDYIGTYWTPIDGSRSVDLNGLTPGSLSQTFDVVNGQAYRVSFWMAGNPAGGPTTKTLDATAVVTLPFSFDTTGFSLGSMGWKEYSFTFTATGTSQTLTFASTTSGNSGNSSYPTAFGPALDNVSVTAVPEVSTWIMMLMGFAGVGYFGYRRRPQAALA